MSTSTIGWYARRLRRMGPREVGLRATDLAWRRAWARRQVTDWADLGEPAGLLPGRSFLPVLPSGLPQDLADGPTAEVLEAAEGIMAGTWDVLGTNRKDIADPDWFLDVVTGIRAPSRTLAFTIKHRDESHVGNVKSLWEVSRHHHLTLLAAAWRLSGDERYAAAAQAQLRSWWRANPFLSGVHWTSGIEVAIRLISWTWIRRLLDGWSGVTELFEDNDEALWQLRWHQEFLARFTSHGSSANNHVVAEASGLLVASCAFPWFDRSASWRAQSHRLLGQELERNTFPSGVNRELATDYHRFVTELGLVAAAEADAAGCPMSPDTWALLARSLDVAAALLDVTGQPPRQGDGDEGRALVVDGTAGNAWLQLLGVGDRLVGRADWWPPAPAGVEALALGSLARPHQVVGRRGARPDHFADAGISLLRSPPGVTPEVWCRCDGGPHGFLSIAAHAHADALSVEVRHGGVPVFVDPGTYCYHGEAEWRDYFRSTLGHNTVEVDGESQSSSGGPFLWTKHARTRPAPVDPVRSVDPGAEPDLGWSAEHDGYMRREHPVRHRRTVSLARTGARLVVRDHIETEGPVDLRLAWHLGPDISTVLDGSTAVLSWGDASAPVSATVQLPPAMAWTTHRGETDPVLGWYSPRFGRRVPTTTLTGEVRAAQAIDLETTVWFGAD